MGVILNRKQRFATFGIRFGRHNPDGTIPTASRFIGFANTVDLSDVLDDGMANLTIKIDAETPETKTIDFSAAVNEEKVTVAEAIAALTAAGFTGITWSVDARTGRLKGSSSSGKIVQIYGKLAAALDFGQAIKHGGEGLRVISFIKDGTISIGLPKSIKDKEEIDSEDASGNITRMVIGAMLQGINPVIVFKYKDYNFLELVQGGTLDRETGKYNPPLSSESEHPTFWGEMFSPVHNKGVNKQADVAGIERIFLRTMIGLEGDVPAEVKAWAQYAYNLNATEYTDYDDGKEVKLPAWEEGTITNEEFAALKLDKI